MKVGLICCGRLENSYAVEWVEHYKKLGFNHIFIGDNNNDGEEYFEDVLQPYINENFVTVYNYRNYSDKGFQWKIYNELYYKISMETDYDWVAIFDFDEFLILQKDDKIQDYLSRDCFKDYNQILINWKCYDDNDLVTNDGRPCLERFTREAKFFDNIHEFKNVEHSFDENIVVKKILRTKCYYEEHMSNIPHFLLGKYFDEKTCNNKGDKIKPSCCIETNYDLSYIKHFVTKTIDEWINNKLVKDSNSSYIDYNIEKFFNYNKITLKKLFFLKENGISIDYLLDRIKDYYKI